MKKSVSFVTLSPKSSLVSFLMVFAFVHHLKLNTFHLGFGDL